MAVYNSLTDRTDAGALIPEDAASEIFQLATNASTVMRLGRQLPKMSRKTRRLPVLSALPTAYWVDGDTGLKQTSEVNWKNVTLTAEELAVIVPVPQAVLDDADFDIWAETKPLLAEAFGKAFDEATFFGTNKPTGFPTDIVAGATAAGNAVTVGTGTDIYDDLLGENGAISKLEADGFMAKAHVAAMSMRGKYRGLRDANGQPIFAASMQQAGQYTLDGAPVIFPENGAFDASAALQISGDWSQLVWAVRQDIEFTIATEAVIQDGAGAIVYNTFQQDMVALRAVFRAGWALPNPINRLQGTEANRYPFAVLKP